MLSIPEYDLERPDSLVVITEDEAIGRSEAEWFDRELVRIAGLNRFGGQNLVRRWGVTYHDPMTVHDSIKYLDFTHNGLQLGERRHIIEVHRSPEFLVRSGRYRLLHEADEVQEFYFCKACDAELKLSGGDLPPCHQCGSTRNYLRQVRKMGGGQLLQPFPEKGCYDYWLRLERANLTYHPPDAEALEVISALWEWEQMPMNRRDALIQADRELERRQMILAERQQKKTNLHFGSGLIVPAHYR